MRKTTLLTITVLLLTGAASSCSDKDEPEYIDPENRIEGSDVGIKRLALAMPRLGLFEGIIDRLDCKLHLKGTADHVTYPAHSVIRADKDSVYVTVDTKDSVLKTLPHQMYHLNYITAARKGTRAGEAENDTVYLGARLSIEDPNNIHFRSSFNLTTNSIGSGTEEDPIPITCGKDFLTKIGNPMTEGETHKGMVFELTDNINFLFPEATKDKGWEPVGHHNIEGTSTSFEGELNGNGNLVTQLHSSSATGCCGLFYSLERAAYIHDIQFSIIQLNGSNLAGIIASESQGATIENIQADGSIQTEGDAGGFIGKGYAHFTNCISIVTITGTGKDGGSQCNIGGFIGREVNSSSTFTNCVRIGNITGIDNNSTGGFVGLSNSTDFVNCYVAGAIAGATNVGGFVGTGKSVEFTGCYVGITMADGSYAYPWQGILDIDVTKSICPFSITATGSKVGGFIGETETLSIAGENGVMYEHNSVPPISGDMNTSDHVGSLCGHVYYRINGNGAKFTNVASVNGHNYTGGIFGRIDEVSINGTYSNSGNVSGNDYIGGIAGYIVTSPNWWDFYGHNLRNTAEVHGASYIGGIAGFVHGEVREGYWTNEGSVYGSGANIGGAVGEMEDCQIWPSLTIGHKGGSLSVTGDHNVGGIVGFFDEGGWLRQWEVHANVAGEATVGGVIGYVRCPWSMSLSNGVHDSHKELQDSEVSVSAKNGNHCGGAIGYLELISGHGHPGADISNIQCLHGTVTGHGSGVGGLIGKISNPTGRCTITNCVNYMEVKCSLPSGADGTGGIVGLWDTDEAELAITRCANKGNVTGAGTSGGAGILGWAQRNITIEECYNEGTIDVPYANAGIVGRLFGRGTISDCYNVGSVVWTSSKSLIAGILGHKEDKDNNEVSIKHCYNTDGGGWGIVGGEEKAKIERVNCYYLNIINDMKGGGSYAKSADDMRKSSTYSGFSSSIWTFHNGQSAPTLKNAPAPTNIPLAL